MSFTVGIGIVTYNRKQILSETIDRVRAFTRQPDAALVVADDGSTDGTMAMLHARQVPAVTGPNMGIAWNKNRALFLLSHMLACETVILLEDDTQPTGPGWEDKLIRAARRWGHINFAGDGMHQHAASGSGTVEDPVLTQKIAAQCSAFSRAAIGFGGYFDPSFRGYGHEHVEHTHRLVQAGYGGTLDAANRVFYYLIGAELAIVPCASHNQPEQEQRNLVLARQLMMREGHRVPWRDNREMRQFRCEIETAMGAGAEHFRLTPAEPHAPRAQQAAPGSFTPTARQAEPGDFTPTAQEVGPGYFTRLLQRS